MDLLPLYFILMFRMSSNEKHRANESYSMLFVHLLATFGGIRHTRHRFVDHARVYYALNFHRRDFLTMNHYGETVRRSEELSFVQCHKLPILSIKSLSQRTVAGRW